MAGMKTKYYSMRRMRVDLLELAKHTAIAAGTTTEEVINRALAIGLPQLARQIKEVKERREERERIGGTVNGNSGQ
jgi:hypothetical protein